VTQQTYRDAFEKAKADLAAALEKKHRATVEATEAEAESIQLRRAVSALAALCGENVEDSMGLTEAVRTSMQIDRWFALKRVKQDVSELGVDLTDLKNADASVLSVLNRLVNAKEIEVATVKVRNSSQRVWRKKSENPPKDSPIDLGADDDIPF